MSIHSDAPWHYRAWQRFCDELLPGLLGERLPLHDALWGLARLSRSDAEDREALFLRLATEPGTTPGSRRHHRRGGVDRPARFRSALRRSLLPLCYRRDAVCRPMAIGGPPGVRRGWYWTRAPKILCIISALPPCSPCR